MTDGWECENTKPTNNQPNAANTGKNRNANGIGTRASRHPGSSDGNGMETEGGTQTYGHGCLLRLRARGQTDNQTDPREARKQSNWLPGPGAQNNPRPGPKTIKNVPKQSQNAPKQSKNVNGAAFGGAQGRFAPRD